MNQPQEPRFDKLEQRVENNLEHTFREVIKNEEQLIRLSQRHRLNTQELKAITGRIELDIEDLRERLDKIEAAMATKQDIAVLKAITEHIQLDIGDSRERLDKADLSSYPTISRCGLLKGGISSNDRRHIDCIHLRSRTPWTPSLVAQLAQQ